MPFKGSYLEVLRRKVGSDLVLMPGACVLVENQAGQVLFVQRADDGSWCHPGGHAEAGGSFAETGVRELVEETGIKVDVADLRPFASISEAAIHTLTYSNGDRTQCFGIWFAVQGWSGDPNMVKVDDESTDIGWFAPDALPSPMFEPALLAMELYGRFKATGEFQAR